MTVRRPLVRINGRNRQLPVGDTIAGAGEGGTTVFADAYLPVFTADGATRHLIKMVSGSLLVYLADNTPVNVGLIYG